MYQEGSTISSHPDGHGIAPIPALNLYSAEVSNNLCQHERMQAASLAGLGDQRTPCLLDLPGEILNQIARLILVPGRVTIYATRYNDHYRAKRSPPNLFSLLATCRQFYKDYVSMFYGGNVFHLPAGFIHESELYLKQLHPSHQAMIRQMSISFTVADAEPYTPAALLHPDGPSDNIVAFCQALYTSTFVKKLALICRFHEDQLRNGSYGLEAVILRSAKASPLPEVVLEKEEIMQELKNTAYEEARRLPYIIGCGPKASAFTTEAMRRSRQAVWNYIRKHPRR